MVIQTFIIAKSCSYERKKSSSLNKCKYQNIKSLKWIINRENIYLVSSIPAVWFELKCNGRNAKKKHIQNPKQKNIQI